jgi:hypothetical protein
MGQKNIVNRNIDGGDNSRERERERERERRYRKRYV